MRAAFFDLAIIKNNDLISIGNRRQPVRNHHRCAVFGNLIKGGFDALFGARIKRRCGLIQYQNGRGFQNCAGNRHALLFAAG